jgi:hypothetical protein
MSLASSLREYVAACFTGIWIQSHEHDDALAEIAQLCRDEDWRLAVWDVAQGLQIPGQNGDANDDGGSDPVAAIRSINGAKPWTPNEVGWMNTGCQVARADRTRHSGIHVRLSGLLFEF